MNLEHKEFKTFLLNKIKELEADNTTTCGFNGLWGHKCETGELTIPLQKTLKELEESSMTICLVCGSYQTPSGICSNLRCELTK